MSIDVFLDFLRALLVALGVCIFVFNPIPATAITLFISFYCWAYVSILWRNEREG